MTTTCVALSNQSGIVIASDTYHTVYQLAKKYPFAVAVDSFSPLPWEEIINNYIGRGESLDERDFMEYVKDFEDFLETLPFQDCFSSTISKPANIIFLGYGRDDIFPCVYDTMVAFDEEQQKNLFVEPSDFIRINHNNMAQVSFLGNLDSISTLIWGINRDMSEVITSKYDELFETYKKRVIDKFQGTDYEEFVKNKLEEYNPRESSQIQINQSIDNVYDNVLIGIDSFSIEDMVTAAETIVNAEVRLDHLASGCGAPLHSTCEIAVITRTEGLTWIKHPIFA